MTDGTLLLDTRTASDHITTSYPRTRPGDRAGDVRAGLAGRRFESASHIAVCVEDRLVGLIRLEDLLAADPATPVEEVMDRDPPRLSEGTNQEMAAWKAVQHRESSLAVEGPDGALTGLIPPHRMLAVLLAEHDEDMARLSGVVDPDGESGPFGMGSIGSRWRRRMPWLLVGLAGAMVAALVVGSFEERLSRDVVLAAFLPALVYMADAVGTQTETIVIRSLSIRGRVDGWGREILTGLLVGVTLAVLFVPIGLTIWGRLDVVLAVAVSLLAACSLATAVALALPFAFHRAGIDPAYGSGPLATVVQDVLTIIIYFAVVSMTL